MGFPFNVQCKHYPCVSAPFAEQGRAEKQKRRLTRSEGAKKKPLRAWIKFSLACWHQRLKKTAHANATPKITAIVQSIKACLMV